jgi:hypothetical protein
MLIYLLKATLVWAFSLLLFETLLRKNSYHAANRFYLLMTLLAGFVIPLIEWPTEATAPVALPVQQTFERISTAADPIATTGGSSGRLNNGAAYLLALYACGVGVALSRIVRDAVAIRRLRRSSTTLTLAGSYTLHETRAQHGPFSFFRSIYISSRDAYTADEFEMVIAHERQHGRLLHSVDMFAVQTLKVVFWFHPLIHLYESRLRLVHEYEADEAAAQEPANYGRFLVEQALSSPSLTLTHSFHSPIKTRILMLTQNKRGSGRALRYLLTLPLIAALVAFFSIPGYTDERKQVGNKLFYNGNEFEMTEKKTDTMIVQDAVTGKDMTVVTTLDARPLSVNGEKIYDSKEVVRGAEYSGKYESATAEYITRILPVLSKLPDGLYRFFSSSVVISKEGKLIYDAGARIEPCYGCKPRPDEPAVQSRPAGPGGPALPSPLREQIEGALAKELSKGFSFRPAELKGKPVNAYLERDLDLNQAGIIVVQNGKARLRSWD